MLWFSFSINFLKSSRSLNYFDWGLNISYRLFRSVTSKLFIFLILSWISPYFFSICLSTINIFCANWELNYSLMTELVFLESEGVSVKLRGLLTIELSLVIENASMKCLRLTSSLIVINGSNTVCSGSLGSSTLNTWCSVFLDTVIVPILQQMKLTPCYSVFINCWISLNYG